MAEVKKCSEIISVSLEIEGLSETLKDWYIKHACELVQLTEDINKNVEAYNKLVDRFNNEKNQFPAGDSIPTRAITGQFRLDVIYSFPASGAGGVISAGALVAAIESMVPLAGTDMVTRTNRQASGIIQAVTDLAGSDFGWELNETIVRNALVACDIGYKCTKGNNLYEIEASFYDINHSEDFDDGWEAAREAAKSMSAKGVNIACKIWNSIFYQKGASNAQKVLGRTITTQARDLKELWDAKTAAAQDALGLEMARRGFEATAAQNAKNIQDALDRAAQDADVAEDVRQPIEAAKEFTPETAPTLQEKAFSEQCFLLAKIFELAAYKKEVVDTSSPQEKALPYYENAGASETTPHVGNACLMLEGDPYAFVNRLTQHPAQGAFFNMKTEEISSLQPTIRLFKLKEKDGEEIQQEIMFDSHASIEDVESLFNNTAKRGFGVGIKDFSFTYDGSTPFAAKKSIKAKLQIFASSFDELLVNRGPSTSPYAYADLALKTGTIKVPERAAGASCQSIENIEHNIDKLNYRLKALVGWARPSGDTSIFTTKTASGKGEIMDAINESYVTLNLTPTTHEFNIDELGRVNFTINYLAYIEDFFDQSHFDIFYEEEATRNELRRKFEYRILTHPPAGCEDTVEYADKLGNWKEKLIREGTLQKDKFKKMQSLMNRLGVFEGTLAVTTNADGEKITHSPGIIGKIRYINLSKEDLIGFTSEGPFYEPKGELKGKISESPSSPEKIENAALRSFVTGLTKPRTTVEFGGALGVTLEGAGTRAWTEEEIAVRKDELSLTISNSTKTYAAVSIGFFYISDLVDIILGGIEERLTLLSDEKLWDKTLSLAAATVGRRTEAEKVKESGSFKEQYQAWKTQEREKVETFKKAYKRFRLLLGPLELVKPSRPKEEGEQSKAIDSSFVSFGDIPVSTKYFMEWMTDKLTTREQEQYGLNFFLNDFFKDLVGNFLNNDNCFSLNVKQKTILNQAIVTSYKEAGQDYDEITKWILDYDYSGPEHPPKWYFSRGFTYAMPRPILNISGPHGRNSTSPIIDGGIENEINYLVFSAARTQPSELQNGSRFEDEARGINHYIIGRPRGIVKRISFSKAESQHLQAVRFEKEGYDGLQQLRQVYNVDIDCFANVKAFPGTYIYVDPRGFAPNAAPYGATDEVGRPNPTDLTRYGIGGYCMIYRSEHSFAPGKADTKITAAWVAGVDTECGPSVQATAGDGGMKKKCAT